MRHSTTKLSTYFEGIASGHYRENVCWRKNRLAARVLYRKSQGKHLRPRDIRIVTALAEDLAIEDRLLGQALSSLEAQYGVAS